VAGSSTFDPIWPKLASKQTPQFLYFFLVFTKQGILRVFVDVRFVLDVFSSVGVPSKLIKNTIITKPLEF